MEQGNTIQISGATGAGKPWNGTHKIASASEHKISFPIQETIYISQRTREAIKQERREEVKTFALCLTGCLLAVLAVWVALVVAFSL